MNWVKKEMLVYCVRGGLRTSDVMRDLQEVPCPVRGSGKSHARSPVAGWVELGNDGPDQRTPGGGKSNDKEAGEDDEQVAGSLRVLALVQHEVASERVDHEAHEHPQGTSDQSIPAAALLDDVQTTESAGHVDGTEDDLGDVAVAEADTVEDGCAVVEKEVGARELLAGLEGHAEHSAVKHLWAGEDLVPSGIGTSLLLLELDADVVDLLLDLAIVGVQTGKAGNVPASLIHTAHAVSETGRLRQEEDANTEDQGPEEGDTVGNSPRGTGGHLLGTEVDHLRGPDAEGDEELVACDEQATDNGRGGLALVHRDQHGEGANANAVDATTGGELAPLGRGRDLNDGANAAEESGDGDGESAAKRVGNLSGDQATDHAASAKKGGDCALSYCREGVGAVWLKDTEAAGIVFHQEET
jgi:hypothetical protein